MFSCLCSSRHVRVLVTSSGCHLAPLLVRVPGKACLLLTCCNTKWNVHCTLSASKMVGIYICTQQHIIFLSLSLSYMHFWGMLGIFEHALQRCRPFSRWMQLSSMNEMKNCKHRKKKDGAMKAEREWWRVLTKRNKNGACQKGCRGEWEEKMAKNGALNGGWRVHRRSPRPKPKPLTGSLFYRWNLSLWRNCFWCKRACLEVCKHAHIRVRTITVNASAPHLPLCANVVVWSVDGLI